MGITKNQNLTVLFVGTETNGENLNYEQAVSPRGVLRSFRVGRGNQHFDETL